MDSDFLGSLMYLMSLCDNINTKQQFGNLMNDITIQIGRKLMSKILFAGLKSINNTDKNTQNVISSMIKITQNTINSNQSIDNQSILKPSNYQKNKRINYNNSILQQVQRVFDISNNNENQTVSSNTKEQTILDLHIDNLTLICSFLQFHDLLSLEKCNKLLCAISRRPSSLYSVTFNSFDETLLGSYWKYINQHHMTSIDLSRIQFASQLQLKCELDTFLPSHES